jgi:hypothetical protein
VLSSILKPGFTWTFTQTDRLTRYGVRKKWCQITRWGSWCSFSVRVCIFSTLIKLFWKLLGYIRFTKEKFVNSGFPSAKMCRCVARWIVPDFRGNALPSFSQFRVEQKQLVHLTLHRASTQRHMPEDRSWITPVQNLEVRIVNCDYWYLYILNHVCIYIYIYIYKYFIFEF